jgi:hypothetical protein
MTNRTPSSPPRPLLLLALLLALLPAVMSAQDQEHLGLDSPFASFVEPDFPFFCQTIDARAFGESPEPRNLVPRGIIIPMGGGIFGCFDPDLLRWALFWKANEEGEYLSMNGMATGSYRLPNRKSPAGQKDLPRPLGSPLLASPLLPGAAPGEELPQADPRERGQAEEGEIGLGPVPAAIARFSGIRLVGDSAQIEYTVGGTLVKERALAEEEGIVRLVEVGPREAALVLRAGPGEEDWVSFPPAAAPTAHRIVVSASGRLSEEGADFPVASPPARRWAEAVETGAALPPAKDGPWFYDDLPLPVPNPWGRNVRISDLEFLPDGRAAFLTFDGDVWIAEGIAEGSEGASWHRFASGLHEPQSFCLIDGEIHVFDRNGVVRLVDADGNGEADWFENVFNQVAQSAETRDFPMDIVAIPGGGFYLAKGGQIGTTIGKHNGTIVRVAPDYKSFEIVSTGLRQPYLGYDPESGILTASDQQGNWKPATPIYRIEPGRYFGFQPEPLKDRAVHPAPIDPAEVWIPHFINQSGASQVWVKAPGGGPSRMGALDGSLVHLGFNRPEIFKLYLDPEGQQGAVVPLLSGFPAGLLNGRVHPRDGLLYLVGFKIWGTSGERICGLFRVRPGATKGWLPREIRAERRGVLLRFDEPLAPELVGELGRYSADRWNYRQTHEYGSGNYRLDGEPGQETVPVASARLSKDGKSLFVGLPGMQPCHTLRLTYRPPSPAAEGIESAFLTVRELPSLDLAKLGFEDNEVDLTPPASLTTGESAPKPSLELGRQVSVAYGCVVCHATGDPAVPAPPPAPEGATQVAVGPPWAGLWEAKRTFSDGSELRKVDEAYLRESILDPARRVPQGYEIEKTGVGMPSYLGVLKDHEIDSIVLYIQSLKKAK